MLLAGITTFLKQGAEKHSDNPGGSSHEIDDQSESKER
jgi:hypothetical protein